MKQKKELIIIGTGGHAKVLVDLIEDKQEYEIIGFTSKDYGNKEFCGYPILGDDTVLTEYYKKGVEYVALGVGGFKDNNLRLELFKSIRSIGFKLATLIDSSCIISKSAVIKEGAVLLRGVILNNDVTIGENSIIYTGSTIDHETIIENNVLISAGVTIGANVKIEEGVLCALGSKVVSGVRIRKNILVGAGAVVVKNLEEKGIYMGCPAKKVP